MEIECFPLLKRFSLFALIGVLACGGDDKKAPTPTEPPVPEFGTVTGTVTWEGSQVSGTVPDATVSADGKSTTTGPDGSFRLEDIAVGDVSLSVEADLFTSVEQLITVPASGATVQIEMEPDTSLLVDGVAFVETGTTPVTALAVHEPTGDYMGLVESPDGEVVGAVYVPNGGEPLTLKIGSGGLPAVAFWNGYTITYSNYSDSTVDVSVRAPDGSVTTDLDVPVDLSGFGPLLSAGAPALAPPSEAWIIVSLAMQTATCLVELLTVPAGEGLAGMAEICNSPLLVAVGGLTSDPYSSAGGGLAELLTPPDPTAPGETTAEGLTSTWDVAEEEILSYPDLSVEAISAAGWTEAVVGEDAIIDIDVAEITGTPVAEEFLLRYFLSPVPGLTEQSVVLGDRTAAGPVQRQDVFAIPSVPPGEYYLVVLANAEQSFFELNVDNNLLASSETYAITESPGEAETYGVVQDLLSLDPIAGAQLELRSVEDGSVRTVYTDALGAYRFLNIPVGAFELEVSADGYDSGIAEAVQVLELEAGDLVNVDFALPPETFASPVGGVSGRVTDDNGLPLGGAVVEISGGGQTNGVFRSVNTALDGTYSLTGLTLVDADGAPIVSFSVTASAGGYSAETIDGISITDGQTVTNLDFALVAPVTIIPPIFQDDFESGLSWSASGFWNRTQGGIANAAYPDYVQLAPDDESGGVLPDAPSGDWFVWFGTGQGNFLGTQDGLDTPLSGGTSETSHSGVLASPSVEIPASGTYLLEFETWFEVEGRNPGADGDGYDLMTVAVETVGSGAVSELATLNPSVDPEVPDRDAIPFTSGGFNREPIVRPITLDLSAYAGETIRIVFGFDTVDEKYNGFRGWLIDDVVVRDASVAAPLLASPLLDMSGAGTLVGERCGADICMLPKASSDERR